MGTDLGVSLAASTSATSGLQGNNRFGDLSAGGLNLPKWLPLALIAGSVVVAALWLVTRR